GLAARHAGPRRDPERARPRPDGADDVLRGRERRQGLRRRRPELRRAGPALAADRAAARERLVGARDLDPARRAQVEREPAFLALRLARVADAPAVPDQQVREARPVLTRDEPHEIALDLHGVLLPREREPL